ncbi:hypothetical protein BV911_15730 [Pseudoruegeria sp. SK021]|nr:hypothetical protein BV911_15730 [Pseudoruegeria sp. SK021]
MKERTFIQRDSSDFASAEEFANAFFEALEANCIPVNVRATNKKRCQQILEQNGLYLGDKESTRRIMEYSEDSAVRLAHEWLVTFAHVVSLEAKVANGQFSEIPILVGEAEHLGTVQERMWWRCEVDLSTGRPREELAISGREYRKKSDEGAALRRGEMAIHTVDVPAEMQRLIDSGHTISNAARIAASNGIGRNGQANRAIWYQRKKKVVTHP